LKAADPDGRSPRELYEGKARSGFRLWLIADR
jgi:hypothetical protein